MPDPTDIPGPLSDRSLTHGRNVMAAASVILVLAYLPAIEIGKFKPLGFDFSEGGELSVWGILAVVLFYYAIRFGNDCWTDYNGWIDSHGGNLNVPSDKPRADYVYNRHVRRLRSRFWGFDVAPPAFMFLVAFPTVWWRMYQLWPSFQFPIV